MPMIPMSQLSPEQGEIQRYGCRLADFERSVRDSIGFKFNDPNKWRDAAMSVLSDAQEEADRGMTREACQSINRAKWIIRAFCEDRAGT